MNRKNLIYLIIFCFCLQCCTIYRSTPVTPQEAVNKGKAKLITADGTIEKYKKIEMVNDSTYKGIRRAKGENIEFPFSENTYDKIFIENRGASDAVNALVVLQVLILIFSINAIQSGSFIKLNGI